MPIDRDGNRADIVMDDKATISRMNLGRLHEGFFNSACRDVGKQVKTILGLSSPDIKAFHLVTADRKQQAYDFLLGFYKIISEVQYQYYLYMPADARDDHLWSVVKDKVYVYYPVETDKDACDIVRQIQQYHAPTYGPVTYRGNSGQMVTTKYPVRIAPLYMMLLEKIADDWNSVSSGKLHHFGVLAPITKSEKFSNPFRNSPVRTIGETEGRIFSSYCGREAIAEMMDRSNNPRTTRNVVWNILNADKPTDIDNAVDRDFIRLGGGKPNQLVAHVLKCAGMSMKYKPEGS